jgi:hypothetical protein
LISKGSLSDAANLDRVLLGAGHVASYSHGTIRDSNS